MNSYLFFLFGNRFDLLFFELKIIKEFHFAIKHLQSKSRPYLACDADVVYAFADWVVLWLLSRMLRCSP